MSDTPAGPTVDGSVVIGVPPQPSITRPGTPVYVVLGEAFRLGYEAAPAGEYYAIWNKTTGAVEKFPLTEDGWRRAWTTFAGLEPAAAAMPLPAPGIETSTETARRKLRQRLSIGGGALVAIAIALRFILPLAFGSATAPGGVLNKTVFTENFDKPSEGWVVESTSRHDARFVGGAYEIVTKNPKDDAESFKFLSDKTFASVAVQVKGTQSGGAGLWGVVCASLIDPSSNAATGYLFALIPGNQAWFMARVESSNDQPLLAQGTSSAM